jgi:hypothetical protein
MYLLLLPVITITASVLIKLDKTVKLGLPEYTGRDDVAITCTETNIPEIFSVFGVFSGK